jgi:hypothetical protein
MDPGVPMQTAELMDEDRKKKVVEIKTNIQQGQYQVDVIAVADAIVNRLRHHAEARAERAQPQNECSYPTSLSPSASVNLTPPGPSSTAPIQVSPGQVAPLAVAG